MTISKTKGLLPEGLHDDLPPAAAHEAEVTEQLMASFAAYGYKRVKPPLVEFEETLMAGPGAAVAPQMFRLMDPVSQRMMGVRSDITLQVARIATTRLANLPRPARLSYAGPVLRVRGGQLRPEREFGQVGVELVGAVPVTGDAEVITLAAAALKQAGVSDLSIDLTLPTFVPVVCAGLGLAEEATAKVRAALDRKDIAMLADVDNGHGELFNALLAAAGPATMTLAALEALDLPVAAVDLSAELGEVLALVGAALPDLTITADPGEFRNFEYHTGLSFTLFAKGVRGELGRGGRYALESRETATGFTLYLDSLMRALPHGNDGPLLFLPLGTAPAESARLRREGWRAIHGLEDVAEIEAEARRLGCSHIFAAGAVRALE